LRRLKLSTVRRLAPEADAHGPRPQRWSPEDFLASLIEAEVGARDASNAAPG